jgi:Copper type II ascorbate-dependent monooxygenase, C-terminal domain/Copper type II ascorbate-dependent monooxygenase, N-terminal domain
MVRGKTILWMVFAQVGVVSCGKESTVIPPPVDDGIPCVVAAVVRDNCQRCHAEQPLFGAPMALTTAQAFRGARSAADSRPVFQVALDRVQSAARPMPPEPYMLGEADRGVLVDWLKAGAPEKAAGTCGDPAPTPDGGAPPPQLCPEGSEVYRAHAPGAPDQGFVIPTMAASGVDMTMCFTFARRPGAEPLGISWEPVLDNAHVLHHMNLYAISGPVSDGDVAPCRIQGATYLMGWEPGRPSTTLPDDIGLELPTAADSGLLLEVHYHTQTGGEQLDRSGMRFCTTASPRRFTAGVLTLGTDNIVVLPGGQSTSTGYCPSGVTGELGGPLHVISSAPHMHQLGRSLTSEILHPDGSTTPLVDVPSWDPHQQPLLVHSPMIDVRPGDAIRTTCTYADPIDHVVMFGPKATDEMCYSYNLVYPISALPSRLAETPLRLCDCTPGESCNL